MKKQPNDDHPLPSSIGPFAILKSLGKGGMGEVFLAKDPKCDRVVALKRIRPDLSDQEIIKNRFLKEARITSRLAHPSIVPIYSIHEEDNQLYYIMPYLEGTTLKELIRKGEPVAFFLRSFLSVCQAVAYAHSKGFLHRDLKPENIIIGNYGQVYILDWGLVKAIQDLSDDDDEVVAEEHPTLTRPGKLVGTLAYMAPERVLGAFASISTDIYALGIIFYQILTLHLPFRRKTIKEFKANLKREKLANPIEFAPYRDIPPELARSVKKCLSMKVQERYPTVDALIEELENYLEGHSEWLLQTSLDIHKKSHWEFQEHTLMPTRAEWASVMISKEAFTGNTKLFAKIRATAGNKGIGLLISVPDASDRAHPSEGYCLWLSSTAEEPSKLLRSTAEIMHFPEAILPINEWVDVRLEKSDRHIHGYLNERRLFSYTSHLPIVGTHIGILFHDTEFEILPLEVSLGSLNLKVSCLSIADAFLSSKDFTRALAEYRRIGRAFPGRQEAREALFLAGITLLEEAKATKDPNLFNATLSEFERLRGTPGAPLEYLGKALVYETTGEVEEEIKCFSLAFKRYPEHPLLPVLQEQILFRFHDRAKHHRSATYQFALLVLTIIPHAIGTKTEKLLSDIENRLEPLPFCAHPDLKLQLAFWLDKPHTLREIGTPDAHLCLLKLGHEAPIPPPLDHQLELALDADDLGFVIKHAPKDSPLLIWAYLLKHDWTKADELLHRHPLEELTQETSLLHFLYGVFLYHTEGKERATIHFQSILDTPYPPSYAVATHYLFSKGLDPETWLSNALPYEKLCLRRQLHLISFDN